MILFFIVLAVSIAILYFVRPEPESLRTPIPGYTKNLLQVKFTLFTVIFLALVHLLITNFTFLKVDKEIFYVFSLKNTHNSWLFLPVQTVTHSFIHTSTLHLLGNLAGLVVLSVYERRVGSWRALKVFLAGMLAAIPSVFLFSSPTIVAGASGAIFALAAAYFIDQKDLSNREWGLALVYIAFIFGAYTVYSEIKTGNMHNELNFKVDHIGHLLGVIGGIIFCRLYPLTSNKTSMNISTQYNKDNNEDVATNGALSSGLHTSKHAEATPQDKEVPGFSAVSDELVRIDKVESKDGLYQEFIHIDDTLSTPFIRAVEKYQMGGGENMLKEETFNVLFRIQDRLARYHNKKTSLEELINLLEASSLKEYLSHMRKHIR